MSNGEWQYPCNGTDVCIEETPDGVTFLVNYYGCSGAGDDRPKLPIDIFLYWAADHRPDLIHAAQKTVSDEPSSLRGPRAQWGKVKTVGKSAIYHARIGDLFSLYVENDADSGISWTVESNGGLHTDGSGEAKTVDLAKIAAEDLVLLMLDKAYSELHWK